MTLSEIRPGSPEHRELAQLARGINDNHKAAQACFNKIKGDSNELLKEIVLAGEKLNKARALIPASEWEFWVQSQCPAIGAQKAAKYIKAATDPRRLAEGGEIKQLLMFFGDEQSKQQTGDKPQFEAMPAYMTGLDRAGSFLKFIDRVPLDKWPDCGIEQLKEDFEPIAKRLWPERF